MQPQATTTPSFARFEKRSASPSDPSFQEWATRHIPLTTPTDSSSFKSPRMSSESARRFRDAPVPFSDSPFRSFSSGVAGNIWPKDPTRPPRDRVAASTTTTTTTTARSAPKQKEPGSDEYPLSEFAPNNIPADKWFLLAKDPDFLNNIAWSAQLYINNKTKGAGYLRSKQNRKPTEQELEFHPFQGFSSGLNQQGVNKVQEAIRSERARPSFKPSPLLSMNKDRQDSVWTPSQFLSSTTPRTSPPAFQPSSPPQPPPPQPQQQQQQQQQRPAQVQQQQFTPAAPKPTYPKTVPKQTQPYRPGPTTQQVTRPWTPQQVKKQRYQQSNGYGPGPAYQVTLTSASDYQVILTRPPPPTAATLKATRPAPARQLTSASTPAVTRSRPQVQPPRVISPSQLPLESPPQLYKYLRPPTRAPKSTLNNNQRSQQQTTPTVPSTTTTTTTPRPTQPAQQPQQAQASEQAIQISNADGQEVFRTAESEKITSKSVPIRPSVLLSAGGPSSRSPFEFEPGNKKWTVEPSTTRTTGSISNNDVSSNVVTGRYYSTGGSGTNSGGSFRSTAPQINNYVETDVIRGRLIPTSTAQLDPFQHNGEAFSSVNDRNVQSFVVRPRSPLTLASAL